MSDDLRAGDSAKHSQLPPLPELNLLDLLSKGGNTFAAIDKNHNGYLSKAELLAAATSPSATADEAKLYRDLAQYSDKIDNMSGDRLFSFGRGISIYDLKLLDEDFNDTRSACQYGLNNFAKISQNTAVLERPTAYNNWDGIPPELKRLEMTKDVIGHLTGSHLEDELFAGPEGFMAADKTVKQYTIDRNELQKFPSKVLSNWSILFDQLKDRTYWWLDVERPSVFPTQR